MTVPATLPPPDAPPVAEVEYGGPPNAPKLTSEVGKYHYDSAGQKHREYETDVLLQSFGMVDTSPERWSKLDEALTQLNAEGEVTGTKYKMFFLGRHGQGWHNFGASKHGFESWETYWTFQTTDGEITWGPDPDLTVTGERQATSIQKQWKKEIKAGAPVKEGLMRCPLTRTGQTMLLSFGELLTGTPEVWEDWREIYGSHTCDKRSTRTQIAKKFPTFHIEDGFSEEDPLWTATEREDDHSQQVRARRAFDRTFDEAPEIYISVTSHSSILRNALAVLRHPPYPLSTGEMIPVIVKATPVSQPNGVHNGSSSRSNGDHDEL